MWVEVFNGRQIFHSKDFYRNFLLKTKPGLYQNILMQQQGS